MSTGTWFMAPQWCMSTWSMTPQWCYMVHGTPMVHVYMVHGTPMVLDNERARVLGSAQLVVHKAAAPHAAAAFGILIKEARRAHEQYHLERLDEG